jgi:hypothetical protein
MKLKVTIIIALFSICLLNCTKEKKHNKIHKIVFASGGCYGTCPVEVIEIDSSLTYRYHGKMYTDFKGFYTGKITQSLWDSINIKLESANFRDMNTLYEESIDDLTTCVRIYYDNNKVKFVKADQSVLPKKAYEAYNFISKTTKKVKLTPATNLEGFDLNILSTVVILPPPIEISKQ